jgi:glycosyltransferase involved in cell wall biosynthesis
MRIGLIAPPWVPVPPPAYGGTEAVVDRLARGLVAAGHQVVLAAAANSTCPVPRVTGTDPAPDRAPVCGDAVTELRHVVTGYAALTDVDLIHDHTVAGPLCRKPLGSIPVVTTNHGPFDANLTPLFQALREVSVVAISHHQASTAFGVPIARVIHHGIDVEAVPIGRGTGGHACFLGRMSPDKGPREAALIARAAGVPLLMAAKLRERSEREYFEAAVEPLLCSDVEYVGELGTEEKLELLGSSIALLNPLQWAEPFGLVMIEALATGTPVVASPSGSVPELIDDGVDGFLRKSPEALTGALLEAYTLDRRRCREVAVRRFDTRRMVEEHVALYEDLLGVASPANRRLTLASSGVSSGARSRGPSPRGITHPAVSTAGSTPPPRGAGPRVSCLGPSPRD